MSLTLCWSARSMACHLRASNVLASNARLVMIQSHPRSCLPPPPTIWLSGIRSYRTSTTSQMLRFFVSNGRSILPKPSITTESLWARFQLSRFNTNVKSIQGRRPNEWEAIMKLPLGARMKMLIKKYWYVAIPIHMVTCTIWFGLLYLAAKCGINGERLINMVKPYLTSSALVPEFIKHMLEKDADKLGAVAVALFLYKLATPARYATTVFVSVYSIRYLLNRGFLIKSANEIKDTYANHAVSKNLAKRIRHVYSRMKGGHHKK